jgi:hypothetical protein
MAFIQIHEGSCDMVGDNANEQLVLHWFDRLSAGDFDTLKSMLHAQATWTVQVHGVQGAGAHKGPEGIIDDFLAPVRLGLFEAGDPKMLIDNVLSKVRW